MDGAELAGSGCLFQRVADVCLWMKLGATPCSASRQPTAMRWYMSGHLSGIQWMMLLLLRGRWLGVRRDAHHHGTGRRISAIDRGSLG